MALALCGVAFAQNRSVIRDVAWPGFDVQYRELASAQTVLDQGYGADSAYSGEHVWYNPMTAWIIAAASRVTGMPAPPCSTSSDQSSTSPAPVTLFVLAAVLFDGFVAVAALAAFIFLIGTEFPFYYSATYLPVVRTRELRAGVVLSPARRAVPGVPSRRVARLVRCLRSAARHDVPDPYGPGAPRRGGDRSARRARNAPARRRARERHPRRDGSGRGARRLAAVRVEILFRYRLKIVNQFPSASPSTLLDLNELPSLARTIAIPLLVAAAAFGIRAVKGLDLRMRVLFVWAGVVVLLLVANVVRLLLEKVGIHLPPVVPALHFFFYLMTLLAIGVGVAIADASAALAARFGRGGAAPFEPRLAGGVLACVITLALVGLTYPHYLQRRDFTDTKIEAAALSERFPVDVVSWIRAHTSPDDVFLCTDDASLYIVPPAGRKVVATNRYFSNPYVDWVSRDADRSRMFDLLKRGDVEGFRTAAARSGARFILLTRDRSREWLHPSGLRPSDLPDLDAASLTALPDFELGVRERALRDCANA